MDLLYNTDYRKSTVKETLIVAPLALALIVALLWFGSDRNPDPVSGDESSLFSECPQVSPGPCAEAASPGGPIIEPVTERPSHVPAIEETASQGFENVPAPLTEAHGEERHKDSLECTLWGGWYCLLDSYPDTAAHDSSTQESGDFQPPDGPGSSNGYQDKQGCPFPQIPCVLDPGIAGSGLPGQPASIQAAHKLHTY